jgi:signal transduction histidine kinase/PleD family two-component response regulator
MVNSTVQKILDIKKHCTRVLIIDDSDVDLDVYSRFLKKDKNWTFRVRTTTNQDEFFEFLFTETIDLVLIDYFMPQIDGLTLIQEMKNRLQNRFDKICIIMMTGQGSETIAVEAMKSGASDYIVKQLITIDFLQKTIKDNLYTFYLSLELNRAKIQLERNLVLKIALKIRQSLDLHAIIQTAVEEVRDYLQCDRVFIYRLSPPPQILGESVSPHFPPILNCFNPLGEHLKEDLNLLAQSLKELKTWNTLADNRPPTDRQHLEMLRVQSRVSIPLSLASGSDSPWGVLIADFCDRPHNWQPSETQLLEEIGLQLSIGIQQSLLLEELRIQRDLATQSEKAKSVFLANMSHEIRTPMMAILGASELLEKYDLESNAQYFLRIIQSSGQHLLTLINDILDLSKLESGFVPLDQVEFSLHTLLEDLLNVFQVLSAKKGITIALEICPNLPDRYEGDPLRLRQILYNLIANAIKFTSQGQISILVQSLPSVQAVPSDQIQLYFSVRDRGIGIDIADQYKLFSPFFQVENSATRNFQGSGLGLSICKRLVHLMGGEIGVNSRIDEGSTFWFTVYLTNKSTLPHSIQSESRITQSRSIQSSLPSLADSTIPSVDQSDRSTGTLTEFSHPIPLIFSTENFKILLAEDNAINQELIRLMIDRIGCQCDVAENGQVVIEMLAKKSYDLILMDCQMPVLDGYQTTQQIRQQKISNDSRISNNSSDIVIIGLTAYAMEDDRDQCLEAGMNDYLAKPCTFAGLQDIIYKWIKLIQSSPHESSR